VSWQCESERGKGYLIVWHESFIEWGGMFAEGTVPSDPDERVGEAGAAVLWVALIIGKRFSLTRFLWAFRSFRGVFSASRRGEAAAAGRKLCERGWAKTGAATFGDCVAGTTMPKSTGATTNWGAAREQDDVVHLHIWMERAVFSVRSEKRGKRNFRAGSTAGNVVGFTRQD